MPQIVAEISDEHLVELTEIAQANGYNAPEELTEALIRLHIVQHTLAKNLRRLKRPQEDWQPKFVTDPGGGVWHEDDYQGD
jgi:hypothetical protein